MKLQHMISCASEEFITLVCLTLFLLIFALKSDSKRNQQNDIL